MALGVPALMFSGTWTTSPTSETVTLTAGASAGDTVVGLVSWRISATNNISVSDSQGNTWTITKQTVNNGSNQNGAMFHSVLTTALTTSDTITVTWAGTGANNHGILIYQLTGADKTSSQQGTPSSGSGTTGTAVDSGNTTTTDNNTIMIGMVSAQGSSTSVAATNSFTELDEAASGTGTSNIRVQGAYRLFTSATTDKYTATLGTSAGWVGIVAAFKQAPGSPQVKNPHVRPALFSPGIAR